MTADYRAQVEELLDEASGLPDGPSKLTLLEEAARLADMHRDVPLSDAVRKRLIRTATFSGHPEKALAAFSWRLAQADRDPEQFPESRLMWAYKWIVNSLTDFPQITREQIENAFDDMTRRFQRCGYGMRAVYKLRWRAALEMNEPDKAREYYRLWEKAPRDDNTDCLACEQNSRVSYHLFFNKRQKAVELAEPILSGRMSCGTVPESTYSRVLLPLLQLGRVEEAAKYHKIGYRRIRDNRKFLYSLKGHLLFLALTDNLSQGILLFEKHLQWALESKSLGNAFSFYLGVRFLLYRLLESGRSSLKLRLPKTVPCYREEGRYDTAVLAEWADETCRDLAARFDARNGNDGDTQSLVAQRRLKRWLTPYPLGRSRKGE